MSDYSFQKILVNKAIKALHEGRRPVIQSHPGSGKTHIAITIAEEMKRKTLIVVPWREINNQIQDLIEDKPDIEVMTISGLLSHNKPENDIELLIFDEAHHAVAKSYQWVMEQYPNVQVMGLTGTLSRMDGKGFVEIFDKLIEGPSVKELIKRKVLSPYELYAPNVDMPLFNATRLNVNTKGEYSTRTLVESLDVKRAYAAVHASYLKYAKDKTMILYAPSVTHAKEFMAYFQRKGISSDILHSRQTDKQRIDIIERFRNHEIKILCNYNVISEGFNMPDCDGVILVRPTRSLALYIQQAMRGMRYQPDKTAIIIDHTLNSQVFGTPSSKHLWRLEGEWKDKHELQIQEDSLNERLKKQFGIDENVPLKKLTDQNERIKMKNRLITDLEKALASKRFLDLILIQKEYNMGYVDNLAWAYRCAKTYNIPIPAGI